MIAEVLAERPASADRLIHHSADVPSELLVSVLNPEASRVADSAAVACSVAGSCAADFVH
jgi:hypothetical protein